MITKTISYVDFNGNKQTKDYYFHISKLELVDLESEYDGGFAAYLEKISNAEDAKAAFAVFKDIVKMSVGEKSDDGSRFVKNETITNNFVESPAFDELIISLLKDEAVAGEFITGLLPADLAKEVLKQTKKKEKENK